MFRKEANHGGLVEFIYENHQYSCLIFGVELRLQMLVHSWCAAMIVDRFSLSRCWQAVIGLLRNSAPHIYHRRKINQPHSVLFAVNCGFGRNQ